MLHIALVAFASALLLTYQLALGQSAPATLCGFPRVATPPANILLNGTSAFASISVGNTTPGGPGSAAANPTIPVLQQGNITGALVTVEQNSARFRVDGTAPTPYMGTLMPAGSSWQVCGSDLAKFQVVASSTGANSILFFQFYTQGG